MIWRLACLSALLAASAAWSDDLPLNSSGPRSEPCLLLEGMPSLPQRNAEFKDGGKNFCGPTAASNALMWLADRGYPNLKPFSHSETEAQAAMIKQLAAFMGVHREGATASSFMCGVKAYLREAGYSSKSWTASGSVASNGSRTPPDLNLLEAMTEGKTLVWLGLGWYGYDQETRRFTRTSGHWVTLAGLNRSEGETKGVQGIVIADPEFPGEHKHFTLSALSEGTLTSDISKANTKGFFALSQDGQPYRNQSSQYSVLESIQALTID